MGQGGCWGRNSFSPPWMASITHLLRKCLSSAWHSCKRRVCRGVFRTLCQYTVVQLRGTQTFAIDLNGFSQALAPVTSRWRCRASSWPSLLRTRKYLMTGQHMKNQVLSRIWRGPFLQTKKRPIKEYYISTYYNFFFFSLSILYNSIPGWGECHSRHGDR